MEQRGLIMTNWWAGDPDERYWCEVTDRADIGADLKAPKHDEAGQEYWSYTLIAEIQPGDVVFHYSIKRKAFVGASVAGGPMEERPIVWVPHGTVGRKKDVTRAERPGYWRPLYGFVEDVAPLRLSDLANPVDRNWLDNWVKLRDSGALYIPFQLRTDGLRAGQGYLFKLPREFVERWSKLDTLARAVERKEDEVRELEIPEPSLGASAFHPKNDADYEVQIRATKQRRSRTHERLVKQAGEALKAQGCAVATPHPLDLLMTAPDVVIVEAKTTRSRSVLSAVREAVGQLMEYQYFVGPRDAKLCILLDRAPDDSMRKYVEQKLGMILLWCSDGAIHGGRTAESISKTRGAPSNTDAPPQESRLQG
jgi:hypothetical protein